MTEECFCVLSPLFRDTREHVAALLAVDFIERQHFACTTAVNFFYVALSTDNWQPSRR